MADGRSPHVDQDYNSNDYFLKQQAARMLNAIQKGYADNYSSQDNTSGNQSTVQHGANAVYINQSTSQQQPQQVLQQAQHSQPLDLQDQLNVQQQQLQQQLQQVQQAQQQFQQMQQMAQFQQQFNSHGNSSNGNLLVSAQYHITRRGRRPNERRKRRRHTWVKRPTTAYLYFVSKYRETLKEAGEVVPKAKIITQACAEKWRNMNEEEKEPFLELSRRDRERWVKDKALEKKPRDPNRPKRPPSAYFLFLADFRKEYPGKADPAKEITKKAGEAWNQLSDQEKTPYYQNAQVIRTKWERDLEAYKLTQGPPQVGMTSANIEGGVAEIRERTEPLPSSPHEEALQDIHPEMLQGSVMIGEEKDTDFPEKQEEQIPSSSMVYHSLAFNHPVAGKSSGEVQYPQR